MHWSLAITCDEDHREQVEETLCESAPAVLAGAPLTGVVLYRQFGDLESLGMRKDWCEPVQLAIEANALRDFAAIRLEATIEIVQLHAGGVAHRPVKDLAREGLAQRILATLFPSGNEVVALVQQFKEAAYFRRIVLQVAIHG